MNGLDVSKGLASLIDTAERDVRLYGRLLAAPDMIPPGQIERCLAASSASLKDNA